MANVELGGVNRSYSVAVVATKESVFLHVLATYVAIPVHDIQMCMMSPLHLWSLDTTNTKQEDHIIRHSHRYNNTYSACHSAWYPAERRAVLE